MPSLRKTIIFAMILLALGFFYYTYEMKGGKARRQAKEREEKIFLVDASKIEKISISGKDEQIELQKRDGVWYIAKPLEARADEQAVSTMTAALANEKRLRTIAEKPSNLADFGLEKPVLTLSFEEKSGDQAKTLLLGDLSPAGGGVYSKKKDSDEVLLIANAFLRKFERKMSDLRDRTILHMEPDGISSFAIENGGGKTLAVKTGQREWHLKEPVQAAGNFYKIRDAIEKLRREKLMQFVERDPKDLSKYGLDKPALEISVAEKEDGSGGSSIAFGRLDKDKKGVYARVTGSPDVIMIDEKLWGKLPKTASDIRDRTLFAFEREQVKEVGLKTDSEDIQVKKIGKEQWEITKPIETKGDDVRMMSLIWDLKDLAVEEFIEESPADTAKYGIGPDSKKLTVSVENAQKPQSLLVGKKDGAAGIYYAQMVGQKPVYGVSKSDLDTVLRRTLHDLRYKKIMTFKNDSVQKIDLKIEGRDFLFERKRGGWKVKKPDMYTNKDWKINMILWAINDLEFKEIAAKEAADLSTYGLDKPEVLIKLWLDDGEKPYEIATGKKLDGKDQIYLKIASKPEVYVVERKFVEEIGKNISELLEG